MIYIIALLLPGITIHHGLIYYGVSLSLTSYGGEE